MTTQSEASLENNLIKQLNALGYDSCNVKTEDDLVANFKLQIEKLNNTTFSDNEFKKVLNIVTKLSEYNASNTIRTTRHFIKRDDDEDFWFKLFDQYNWQKNSFQVTNQIEMDSHRKNRYDVTILMNGLPLIHLELKKRGVELKKAFDQIIRYKEETFSKGLGLFQFVQLFVISNGVNTRYYANNRKNTLNYVQTFTWSDELNRKVSDLTEFANTFLVPSHAFEMIFKYSVVTKTSKLLMVLRPYQYYATKNIVEKVKTSKENGYIWHTTGSGKTLTSFKASQILTYMDEVDKVVFVVDRKDLDYQTTKEFNEFSKGSVDGTENTKALVSQFKDTSNNTRLIVTTIQKLDISIMDSKYKSSMSHLKDKKIVFIFDHCQAV